MIYVERKTQKNILSSRCELNPRVPWDQSVNSLSCSEVTVIDTLTGTITIESDFSKPNENMVPQSRGIHRRFYDGGH